MFSRFCATLINITVPINGINNPKQSFIIIIFYAFFWEGREGENDEFSYVTYTFASHSDLYQNLRLQMKNFKNELIQFKNSCKIEKFFSIDIIQMWQYQNKIWRSFSAREDRCVYCGNKLSESSIAAICSLLLFLICLNFWLTIFFFFNKTEKYLAFFLSTKNAFTI